jgi:hypothetical protein
LSFSNLANERYHSRAEKFTLVQARLTVHTALK